MIYLDNAASSWPKPPEVAEAMAECVNRFGANPGRGGHRLARQATEVVEETRQSLAGFFGIRDASHLFFVPSATYALNQAIQGTLRPGDHVVSSAWEHNAVARPLEALRQAGVIEVTWLPPHASLEGSRAWQEAILPSTRLLVATHASNVNGAIHPIEAIGQLARSRGIPLLVDVAQTAGILPIDVEAMGITMLAFPGHKGLMGPQGIGGLYVNPDHRLHPLIHGGTGNRSEELNPLQERPWSFEPGTLNTPGIAGLQAGIRFVEETGVENIHRREREWMDRLIEGLRGISGIRLFCADGESLPLLSFSVDGIDAQEVAVILDQHYDIAVRSGYHCAAMAHRSLKTENEGGTVRVSPGFFNTENDVDSLVKAVTEVVHAFQP
ncbi:aminotransferase class V-fold PLP-dependent enzyme [Desmospora profundinema]|uniref:cysteine desulfurase n=1 Tax=Desmospora profundinema TaxID=1571184 RepID=A0ABU1ILT8_9BACL|nr:aminotransferase class V-fold PLP-dependent enzyme [Desmospora profundinema]MDR6225378.1 cysteine desulfurase family protein [Desmospora profundinema]